MNCLAFSLQKCLDVSFIFAVSGVPDFTTSQLLAIYPAVQDMFLIVTHNYVNLLYSIVNILLVDQSNNFTLYMVS